MNRNVPNLYLGFRLYTVLILHVLRWRYSLTLKDWNTWIAYIQCFNVQLFLFEVLLCQNLVFNDFKAARQTRSNMSDLEVIIVQVFFLLKQKIYFTSVAVIISKICMPRCLMLFLEKVEGIKENPHCEFVNMTVILGISL